MYYESNTWNKEPKSCSIVLKNLQRLTVEGNGSSLIFHGRVQPFTIDDCHDITLSGFSIDWRYPLTAQAKVRDTGEDYLDIEIDKMQYPFQIKDGKLIFAAEGWSGGITGIIGYDYATHQISYHTGDVPGPLGPKWRKYTARETSGGLIRLTGDFSRKPARGSILVFRHNTRDHAMIFIRHSTDVSLAHITGYHAAGLGILSQYCADLAFRHVSFIPNRSKGRFFSGHDDGMHFSNCRGSILIDSCRFEGLMDDPVNIHGTYVRVIRKISDHKLLCRFMHPMSTGMTWAENGNQVSFINNKNLSSLGIGTVTDFHPLNETDFEIGFQAPVPAKLMAGNGLENLTWTPCAVITHSYFGSNRARGILVTTPQPVLIAKDSFSTSGSAILIAGDVNSYFESGGVRDVVISRNTFLPPCNSSSYEFTRAIISIFPQTPDMKETTPSYHRNIRITGNLFYSFDYPVLFAQSVDGLAFENNDMKRSILYAPYQNNPFTFTLIGCHHVRITGNRIAAKVLGHNIKTQLMHPKDITSQNDLLLIGTVTH